MNNQKNNCINRNILNWYPFDSSKIALEIGGDSLELTQMLSQKVKKLVKIEKKSENTKSLIKSCKNLEIIEGNINEIDLDEKFDYVLLIGSLPYYAKYANCKSKEFLAILDKYLKDDGKIIIAVNNKFGIKYFAGNPDEYLNKKFVSMLNYNNETDKIETYTKQKLIQILDENGYKNKNFYYPLPDYRMPNVIFSDEELPKYNNVDKYVPYHTEKADILFDEIDLFREILKTNESMFTFFTNAYLVEASKKENPIKYKYISYNNMRKKEYRLITKIGNEYVEKEIVDDNSSKHYEQIKENIKLLNKSKINTLDEISEDKIRSLYIVQEKLLSCVLAKKLEENKIEEFYQIVEEFYSQIKKVSDPLEDKTKTIFDDYNIEITEEQRQNLNFKEVGLWDMTFKNCFYIDNNFYFFDQEWKDENVPIEYILYRSIVYTISLRRFIDINEILIKYELDKYLEIFKKLDEYIQVKIRDKEIWEYYSKDYSFNIDDTKQELINMQIRSDAKDLAIQKLEQKVKQYEDADVATFIKDKVRRFIRRK